MNLFAGFNQNHKVIRDKDLCPKCFDGEQISNFKLFTELSAIYHDQMYIREQATTKTLLRILVE